MSSRADIVIGLDKKQFDDELNEAEEDARRSLQSIATGVRRTAEVGIFFAEAAGLALDQILSLYIEAGLRSIEFLAVLETGITAGTLGLNVATGRLALQGIAIAAMFAQINLLQRQKAENARRIGFAVSGLRALTF